jgi:hypothetical protein
MDTNKILFLNQVSKTQDGGDFIPWGVQAIHVQYLSIVLK